MLCPQGTRKSAAALRHPPPSRGATRGELWFPSGRTVKKKTTSRLRLAGARHLDSLSVMARAARRREEEHTKIAPVEMPSAINVSVHERAIWPKLCSSSFKPPLFPTLPQCGPLLLTRGWSPKPPPRLVRNEVGVGGKCDHKGASLGHPFSPGPGVPVGDRSLNKFWGPS